MGLYKIKWKKSAEKDIKKLDKPVIPKIIEAVEKLSDNPTPLQSKKIIGAENTYRIRVKDYRIIYSIEFDILIIEVLRVGHRKEIYRKFK